MGALRYLKKDEVSTQEVTLLPTLNVVSLVDSFINSQDVKQSSKN